MATALFLNGERATEALRPVARWVPETGPDGRTRLVMVWSVPSPVVPRQASAA